MLIKVKVKPDADEISVSKKEEDEFRVKVKAEPKRGKANKAVTRVLANYFGLDKGQIRLVKGGKQRNKVFKIPDHVKRRSN
ncbi:MAG: DUF167 domain-containing protein [Candidatus Paceibacterota bacterium]